MKPTGFPTPWGLILLAALSGCAVGPNYHTPAAPDVALTAPLVGGQNFVPGADLPGDWWRLYHNPALNALITQALAHNPSLVVAQENLVQAQETLRASYGVLSPAVSAGLGAERAQPSASASASFGGSSSQVLKPYTLYSANLTVSYALDIWGGARREVESLQAQTDYQRDELEAAYLALTGNIVTQAVQMAALQGQIDAARQVIAAEQQSVSILRAQVQLGGAAPVLLLQQQAQLAAAQASLPPLQDQLAQARNQLSAYAGGFPGGAVPQFSLDDFTLPQTLPLSLPSALVGQRPDIIAAAAQLRVASANVGVADAQMLPQISLSAELGHSAITTASLFTPQTLLWNLVAGLTQPVFEGGELAAKRQGALAALRGAGAQYQLVVVNAFQNVADALAALQYDAAALQAADLARDSAAQSLSLTQAQYQLGAQPLIAVLAAQNTYQNTALAQVKARAARLADTAALYTALGGGWWHRHDVTQTCCGVIP